MSNDELLQIINQAAEEKILSLDLSNQGLTELPPDIGQLTELKELRLDSNQLCTIPPDIQRLKKLEVLILRRNQLSMFLPQMGQLTSLKLDDRVF